MVFFVGGVMYTLIRDMKMSLPVPLSGRFSNIGKATHSIGIGFTGYKHILNAVKSKNIYHKDR